jgi:hypothetical protein
MPGWQGAIAMATPTEQAYAELQHAYDVFNMQLFGGTLPPCLITMQRRPRTYGYFSRDRWKSVAGCVFHAKAATDSTGILPLIPRQSCHSFHTKAATDSMTSLPPIPGESCR